MHFHRGQFSKIAWKFQATPMKNLFLEIPKVLAPRVWIKNAMCHLKIRCHEFKIS
jgi:hypothetical protein